MRCNMFGHDSKYDNDKHNSDKIMMLDADAPFLREDGVAFSRLPPP